jgi:hypothetical protein
MLEPHEAVSWCRDGYWLTLLRSLCDQVQKHSHTILFTSSTAFLFGVVDHFFVLSGRTQLNHPYCEIWISNVQMANEPSSALPPLQRSSVWKFKPLRIVLLGTADKDSILERLPKGDGVLSIILGPLVVYFELQVAAPSVFKHAIENGEMLCAGQ